LCLPIFSFIENAVDGKFPIDGILPIDSILMNICAYVNMLFTKMYEKKITG